VLTPDNCQFMIVITSPVSILYLHYFTYQYIYKIKKKVLPTQCIFCLNCNEKNQHLFTDKTVINLFLPTRTLLYVSVRLIFTNLTSFLGIPNLMRILYKTSLLTESQAFVKSIKSWWTSSLYSHFFSSIS